MANKMTYKAFYNEVIKANISDEMTAFAENAIKVLDNKAAKRAENGTAKQRANEVIKADIVKAMENGTVYTAAAIVAMGIDGVTNTQKVSPLMAQLAKAGIVEVSEVKVKGKGKVNGYTLVETATVETEDESENSDSPDIEVKSEDGDESDNSDESTEDEVESAEDEV